VVSGACAKAGAEQSSSDALNSEIFFILSLLVKRSDSG
jgi:hypothetical protein